MCVPSPARAHTRARARPPQPSSPAPTPWHTPFQDTLLYVPIAIPAMPGPEPMATGEAMWDLEARNKLHCHGNEAPWTDFSQDTARLMADVRAAPSHCELAGPWPERVPRHGVPAHGHLSRAWPGSVVPGGSPGCRRRPGAPAGAAGGQHSGVTVPSPPSTPHTASCPRPLQEEPRPTSAPPFLQQPSQSPTH